MRWLGLGLALALAGCGKPMGPDGFAQSGPLFDPVAFFNGHVTSWGVEETRGGLPSGIVTTDCAGTLNGPDDLSMVQTLHLPGGTTQTRRWHMRRVDAQHYTATANDMAGEADATVSGRALHWRWVLETNPGNGLENVTMDQWMYRMDDGSVMIRTNVTKLGLHLLGISEIFNRKV